MIPFKVDQYNKMKTDNLELFGTEENIETDTISEPINEEEKESVGEESEEEEEEAEEGAGDDYNLNSGLGVYNPDEESDNNPQAAQYKFDEEDEDVFSDVF